MREIHGPDGKTMWRLPVSISPDKANCICSAKSILFLLWVPYPNKLTKKRKKKIRKNEAQQTALQIAREYLSRFQTERTRAEETEVLLRKWLDGNLREDDRVYTKRGDVAKLLDVSIDVLRNWERNGLIDVPRDPGNGYRQYGPKEISRLKVIRTLRSANYGVASILRMMNQIDLGSQKDPWEALNVPQDQEDVACATNRWILALTEAEKDAKELILQLEKMIAENESAHGDTLP